MRPGWRRYIGGVALPVLAALFVLMIFFLLSRTEIQDIDLADTPSKRWGWRYELLTEAGVQAWEPVFQQEHILVLPEEARAVRITRTMTEEIPRAELEWQHATLGVEIRLGGELLYSDFAQNARDENGFLLDATAEAERILAEHPQSGWRRIRMTLPQDYQGKELSIVTYFPETDVWREPVYPFLGSEDAPVAERVTATTPLIGAVTIYAIFTLGLAGMYLLDQFNGQADGRMPLLCLYFALLCLNRACVSDAGELGLLNSFSCLACLGQVYMAPLYLYLSLRLNKGWKYPLCALVTSWTIYEMVWMFLSTKKGQQPLLAQNGLGALIILVLVGLALGAEALFIGRKTRHVRFRWAYGLASAGATVFCIFSRGRGWGSLSAYLAQGVGASLRNGFYMPAVNLLTDISALMAAIVLTMEFLKRTVRARQEMSALRERGHLTLESYNRLLTAQEATNALRHEMRHHMTALSAILQESGGQERARKYIASVSQELDQLPTGRYCQNILINVIAGTYLERAKAEGVQVTSRLEVPAEIEMADEDLSVFLSNTLQNAVQACERMPADAPREIHLEMRLRDHFLFIKCRNTCPQEAAAPQEPEEAPEHGYGLTAMRRVAEKYHSILVTERGEDSFTIKSNLCLTQRH